MQSAPHIASKSILLVDDDEEVRRSFSLLLRARGFRMHTYETGSALLTEPSIGSNSCFLLDYRLPDMNGIELLSSLRRSGRENPAFLITGYLLPNIKRRAMSAGFLEVIEKPADANFLAALLSNSLGE